MRVTQLMLSGVTASATTLFVSDYSGQVTTLELSANNSAYALTQTHSTNGCAPNPSWLTLDTCEASLYCFNEDLNGVNGSIASFVINADSSLTPVQNTTTPNGPVSGVIYGPPQGPKGLAVAHYGGSAVSTWKLEGRANFTKNQEFFYYLDKPGPDASRQEAPHEHEALLDPTGQYVLVPDLGADLVRVFCWDETTLKLSELESLQAKAGSGPRHAAFWNPSGLDGSTTYFYLVAELAATVTAYAVQYKPNKGGLEFTEISVQPTIGIFRPERIVAPAEIQISPDNRFAVISNRNDSFFSLPQANGSVIQSDSLSTWKLNDDGTLTFWQLWAAGGSYPRHFSLSAVGNLVAVGLQYSQEVVILLRDVASGLIGEPVARVGLPGNVTNVSWNQQRALGRLGG